MKQKCLGFLCLAAAVVGLASVGVVGESVCIRQADWKILLVFRYGCAGFLLFVASLTLKTWPKPFHIGSCLWVGLICEGAQAFFLFQGIQRIGAGLTAFVIYFYPLIVLFFCKIPRIQICKKEQGSWKILARLIPTHIPVSRMVKTLTVGSVIGPLLTSYALLHNLNPSCLAGLGFAIAAALCYGYYFSHGALYLRETPPLLGAALSCLGALLVIVPLTIATSENAWYEVAVQQKDVLLLLILFTAIPLFLLVKGMQLMGGLVAALLFSCEPMITALFASFIHKTPLPTMALGGSFITLLLILITEWKKQEA